MASFMVNFSESPNWKKDFAKRFISDKHIRTLRGQIHTSVGYIEMVKPEKNLLDALENARFTSN